MPPANWKMKILKCKTESTQKFYICSDGTHTHLFVMPLPIYPLSLSAYFSPIVGGWHPNEWFFSFALSSTKSCPTHLIDDPRMVMLSIIPSPFFLPSQSPSLPWNPHEKPPVSPMKSRWFRELHLFFIRPAASRDLQRPDTEPVTRPRRVPRGPLWGCRAWDNHGDFMWFKELKCYWDE